VLKTRTDFAGILETLAAHGVDFIIVGGASAALQGAPINTLDLDIVHKRTDENISRLLEALGDLDAYYRMQPERRLRPQTSHLSSPGHQLLTTRLGALDVLGAIEPGGSYADLISHSEEMCVGALTVRVLDLQTLIEIKETIGRDKDQAVLAVLKRTLKEKQSGG
jgi:predicted nucleotidyltransferase